MIILGVLLCKLYSDFALKIHTDVKCRRKFLGDLVKRLQLHSAY